MKKKKILIIADKPNEASMLKTHLEQADYKVICAYDGDEGIKRTRLAKFDVIILDIVISEKDWFKIADKLRNDRDCCMIPTIILTAFKDTLTLLQEGKEPPLFHMWDEYLKKPLDPDELLLHVERIIAKREKAEHNTLNNERVHKSKLRPSPSYSTIIRIEFNRKPGALGEVASAIGRVGGVIGAITIVQRSRDKTIRDITVDARDQEHEHQIAAVLNNIKGVKVIEVSDLTFFPI